MAGVLKVKVGGSWVEVAGGGGGGVTKLEFSFASPSTTWVINHNLGSANVEVNCFDLAGVVQYDPEIEITNTNTVTVKWFYATSGLARVLG